MSAAPEQANQDDITEAPLSDEELDNVSGAWAFQSQQDTIINPRAEKLLSDNLKSYI
ncbi:hypothetical protein [Spongiactinospora rosea]|uniref:hypothetical protein n=1 Tax=Spongiactinospora rosea TaxID=2248750 RepID=UPI00131489BA|nr:hypothetical protein [Spongiactinospora rosea]